MWNKYFVLNFLIIVLGNVSKIFNDNKLGTWHGLFLLFYADKNLLCDNVTCFNSNVILCKCICDNTGWNEIIKNCNMGSKQFRGATKKSEQWRSILFQQEYRISSYKKCGSNLRSGFQQLLFFSPDRIIKLKVNELRGDKFMRNEAADSEGD